MAQGLLGGVLPTIYSKADELKRQVYGLLTDPKEMAQRAAQSIMQSHRERQDLMGQAFADPRNPTKVTDTQALGLLADRVMAGELGFAPAGITAYHGSPYRFNKFDMSKVGTGEGAQAYGHGMYFAEAPDVARAYAKMEPSGPSPSPRRSLLGVEVDPMTPEYKAAQLVDEMGLAKAKKFVADWSKNPVPDQIQFVNDVNKAISNITKKSDVKNLGTENFYKVDIPDAYIPTMMDWDKPLGQQSAQVKKAIESIKKKITPEMKDELGGDLNLLFGKDVTPTQFLNTLEIIHPESITGIGEKWLNEAGVKGIRYLDNTSRGTGKGTSNFVVFDPTDVKILKRNEEELKGLLE